MGNVRSLVDQTYQDNLLTVAEGAGVAAFTDIYSQTIDVGEEGGGAGVALDVYVGTVAATGTIVLTLQEGDAADGSDAADLASPAPISIADTGDDKCYTLEKRNCTKRYYRVKIDRGTANGTILAVGGRVLGIREKPPAHNATVVTSAG